jgi:DNA repair protein RecN (Recombination protein N)
MPKASVAFEITEREPTTHGADEVRLTFAAHESSIPDDIGKIASGGELSRVMLAIEVVRAASESIPTYVFDEVDAGVGGKAAVEIGRRLAKLARNRPSHRRHPPAAGRRLGRHPRDDRQGR